jgi:hypothetical protein
VTLPATESAAQFKVLDLRQETLGPAAKDTLFNLAGD